MSADETEHNNILTALYEAELNAKFKIGETVIYQNGDRFELGIVNSLCNIIDI